MRADIICVGNEILTGLIENTNAGFLSRRLWSIGISVRESCVVADNMEAISSALKRALESSEVIVITGGLGPTDDDLTREAVAETLKLSMHLDKKWLARLEKFFQDRKFKMTENNRKQAMVLDGSRLLENSRGTAPGLLLEYDNGKMIVLLPGPPTELQIMFDHYVIPELVKRNCGNVEKVKTLKCAGIGESMLEEIIKAAGSEKLSDISYVARGYEVNLQIKGKGLPEIANVSIAEVESQLREVLGNYIYGCDDDTLVGTVAKLLTDQNMTVSTAESCSGGLLADMLTDIPGSSKYFKGGLVVYSAEAKINLLGLDRTDLEINGEVSEQTAYKMASAVRNKFNTDFGIGITGLAGPESDSTNKPVGLVYVAIDSPGGCSCQELNLPGARRGIKERAVQLSIDLLRRSLLREVNINE
ncbi:MAG: competence/damage-inducible protein A [Bacillota bacterium]|nr:competence/damage-inducible protein A [Bacillota bacterium]